MEAIPEIVSKEGAFTALFIICAAFMLLKLIPMALKTHMDIVAKMIAENKSSIADTVKEHKDALKMVTDAFLEEIRSNNAWRTSVDNHLRDHTKQLDEINEKLQK
jgi:gas vesicle protein